MRLSNGLEDTQVTLEALLARGRELEREGDTAAAQRLLASAAAAVRGFGMYHYAAGALAFRLEQIGEAVSHFEEAVARDPGIAEYHGNLGAALFELARRAGAGRDSPVLARALRVLEEAVRLGPQLPGPFNALGLIWMESGDQERAVAEFDRALGLEPDDVPAHWNRAAALAACGRRHESLTTLDRLLAIAPEHDQARARRSKLLGELRRGEAAD